MSKRKQYSCLLALSLTLSFVLQSNAKAFGVDANFAHDALRSLYASTYIGARLALGGINEEGVRRGDNDATIRAGFALADRILSGAWKK